MVLLLKKNPNNHQKNQMAENKGLRIPKRQLSTAKGVWGTKSTSQLWPLIS